MSATTMEHLHQINELQLRYIDALDSKKMQAWANTFSTVDGQYICTTVESVEAGWKIALIMDDCPGRIQDRVKFVEKVWAGTFQDYQTRHFVQRIECTPGEGGLYQVRTNFSIAFTRSDNGITGILATGVYHDLMDVSGPQALFRAKKVVIDAPLLPHYIVYPL